MELLGSRESLHLLGDSLELRSVLSLSRELEDLVSNAVLGLGKELLVRIVDLTLLWLAISSGEEDEFALVGRESCDIGSLHLSGLVVSSVVDSNSNRSSKSSTQTGFLELSKRETTAKTGLASILSSAAVDDWPQLAERSWEDLSFLIFSGLSSDLLVGSLVEEALDTPHPMLAEVVLVKDVIVFYHVSY